MKFPFEFSVKLIFRLVLPGFLLSLGFFPLLIILLRMNGWSSVGEYAFIILIIMLGWLIAISDMHIYMLFEGRRYWFRPIRWLCTRRETSRLTRLLKDKDSDDDRLSSEAYFDLRNFPMNSEGEYEVALPSRLGNLLYAFEGYSDRLYGADSIFYWPRIWLKLDKDAREEIDNSQALADSTLYASFALLLSGGLWLIYALAKYLIVLLLSIAPALNLSAHLQYDLTQIDSFLPRKGTTIFIAAAFLLASFLIYRLSLYLHAQFGELFKSVFDLHVMDVKNVTKELVSLSEQSPAASLSKVMHQRDQYVNALRYLQYYRYRCPACNELLKPSEIKTHVCKRTGWPFEPEAQVKQEVQAEPRALDSSAAASSATTADDPQLTVELASVAPGIEVAATAAVKK